LCRIGQKLSAFSPQLSESWLQLLAKADYERLAGGVIEIKRMLTSLIQKLSAEKS